AGKSTIGVVLAKTLGYTFIDTDILIQNSENRLLQEIIDEEGIRRFLSIEERVIISNTYDRCIIATGGSAVLSRNIMDYLNRDSIVVYLSLDMETIISRIKNISTRGIVLDKNQSIEDMYHARKPLYEKYAGIIIDCNSKPFENIISEIADSVRNI
ncbi:MAG: shikimate kinase, partial [Spirochaetota bacterium]